MNRSGLHVLYVIKLRILKQNTHTHTHTHPHAHAHAHAHTQKRVGWEALPFRAWDPACSSDSPVILELLTCTSHSTNCFAWLLTWMVIALEKHSLDSGHFQVQKKGSRTKPSCPHGARPQPSHTCLKLARLPDSWFYLGCGTFHNPQLLVIGDDQHLVLPTRW